MEQNSGELRREKANVCLLFEECNERWPRPLLVIARSPCDEAIQNPSAERFWIASLRSQ
ncbi:hypothetical protein ACVIIV_004700 [Bradyrhizobium sp. USDA 4354]